MNWTEIKITDISKPKQWKSLPKSKMTEKGFLVYSANGVIGKYSEYNHEIPTLIIGCRGTCGTLNITKPRSYVTSNAMALNGIDETKYHLKYLYYALLKRGFNDVITGSSQPQITRQNLSKIKIKIPPTIEIQKQIAKILTDCESLIEKRKLGINLLNKYLESIFSEMFGDPFFNQKNWKVDTLDFLCGKIVDCPHDTPEYTDFDTGYYCVRSSDMQNGEIDLTKSRFVSKETYLKRISRHIPAAEEVVYTREGGRFGNTGRILENKKICLGQRMMLLKEKKDVSKNTFIWALLNSERIKNNVQKMSKGGAAPRVNISDLKKMKVYIPNYSLQIEFDTIVKQVDRTKLFKQVSLIEIENLYASLSQKAFKGELDLRNVDISVLKVEETKPEMEAIGEERWVDKLKVQDFKVNLDVIIKNDFESNLFSVRNLEDAISNRALYVQSSQVKSFLKKAMDENIIEQVYSGDTKQVMFKLKK